MKKSIRNKVFSVLIPVYNAEKYIYECIDSIKKQSFDDFECIIVDDGSADNSLNIINETILNDDRFNVISKRNKGVSDTRNKLLEMATGEYIVWVDADDIVDYELLSTIYTNVVEKELEGCIFSYNILDNNKCIKEELFHDDCLLSTDELIKLLAMEYKMPSFLCNKVFHKRIYKDINFETDIKMLEDYQIMPLLFERCSKVVCLNKALYSYRQIGSSITHNIDDKMLINNKLVANCRFGYLLKRFPSFSNYISGGRVYRAFVYLKKGYELKDLEGYYLKEVKQNFWQFILLERYSIKLKIAVMLVYFSYDAFKFINKLKKIMR